MQEGIKEHGDDAAVQAFVDLQIWGTPEQCVEKIANISNRIRSDSFTGVFSFAGMEWADAERNMKLFAKDVKPHLRRLAPIGERVRAAAE